MPAKRILFVPWAISGMNFSNKFKNSAGAEYFFKNEQWITHCQKKYVTDNNTTINAKELKEVIEVFYSNTDPGSVLRSLGKDDQVYLRGHCYPGLDCIYSKDDYLRVFKTQDPIVRDLMQTVDSTIKVGADCLKADEVVSRIKKMGLLPEFSGVIKCYNCHSNEGNPSFAQTFANAMSKAGYKSCTFYGYNGALDSYHQHKDGFKHSTQDGKRASKNRHIVIPNN